MIPSPARARRVAAGLALLAASPLLAQTTPAAYRTPAALAHVQRALAIAGTDLAPDAERLCRPPRIQPMVGPPPPPGTVVPPPRPRQERPAFTPNRVFDNVWYFGTTEVGATVIRTSRGLVLIDALTTVADAERVLLGGMRKEGLDPAAIRYVIVTHAHGDHHGGIALLRSRYPAFRVVMSADDWAFAQKPFYMPDGNLDTAPKPPARRASDLAWRGRLDLRVGDTTFHLVETPGHTPGTTGLVYDVRSNGKPEIVAQWGGGGPMDSVFPLAAVERFADLADRFGATVQWSSHSGMAFWGIADRRTFSDKAALVAAGQGPNPFVAGRDLVHRYLGVLRECKRAASAEQP